MARFVQLTPLVGEPVWVSEDVISLFSANDGVTTVELESGTSLRVSETPQAILAQIPNPVQTALLTEPESLVAAVNEITVTQTWHTVSVPAGVASVRQINVIHGGTKGAILVLQRDPTTAGDPIINTIGNVRMPGSVTLNTLTDTVVLMHDGSNWVGMGSSNNPA